MKTSVPKASPDTSLTKDRLLDTAEVLFSRDGYRGTSLRTLTAEAGVNLAAVNYHFGSKKALLMAVFARRLDHLNRIRMQRLREIDIMAREGQGTPSVQDIMRAFIAPMFLLREAGEGSRSFTTLIARILNDQDPSTREIFLKYMKPVFHECYRLLCGVLPHLSRETVFWRLVFSTAAASRVMRKDDSMAMLNKAGSPLPDSEAVLSVLIPFVTAGMEAP
jgi:AcrR family transcriptional regulator